MLAVFTAAVNLQLYAEEALALTVEYHVVLVVIGVDGEALSRFMVAVGAVGCILVVIVLVVGAVV